MKYQIFCINLQVLGDLCALVADWNPYSIITSASGSHVARRLLCTVTGRDVTPATGRDAGKHKVPGGPYSRCRV